MIKINLVFLSYVLAVSYNQPKFCPNASWNPNATTFANISTVGSNPFGIFVNTNNTVYATNQVNGLILVWLEGSINPSIASHGGRADLVAMDEDQKLAYVRLSGGCQGCAMSRMTLSQGIETTLREEIPELVGVLDVTDHASGENPFYSN